MAAGSAAKILRIPGRMVVNPATAFASTDYPYGGVEIGKTRLVALLPQGTPFEVKDEGLGETVEDLEPDKDYKFQFYLRGWDDEAIQWLFSGGYSAGSTSQHAVWSEPGNRIPGQAGSGRSISLVYVPDDAVNVPAIMVYDCIPEWGEAEEIQFRHEEEFGLPIAATCIRDSNGNMVRVGRLVDISLT